MFIQNSYSQQMFKSQWAMQVNLYITFQIQAIKVNKYIGTTFQKILWKEQIIN